MPNVRSGLEVLIEQKLSVLRGSRVALVTNHSAVNRNLVHAVDLLRSAEVDLVALFSPEHGVYGDVPDGQSVPSSSDPRTGLPVYSLYGQTRKPTREMLAGVEAVVFDIQDVGCRFYTYIYTMACVMQSCAEIGRRFIVLDRPNPIGGQAVEGGLVQQKFASFVGMYPIPVRHGMTVGELARFINGQFGLAMDVEVVNCLGWKRSMWFDDTGLPWVMPSPNMPTPETAVVYPGTCLLEGTNVSEGRGTAKPFEIFGAPWVDAFGLADQLNALGIEGVRFRSVHFVPTASKYQGQRCGGVQAHVMNRDTLKSFEMGMRVVKALHDLYPKEFQFRPPGASGLHFFDLLAGTDRIRLGIEMGESAGDLIDSWYPEMAQFIRERQRYLTYS